jgi:hypothetical protein
MGWLVRKHKPAFFILCFFALWVHQKKKWIYCLNAPQKSLHTLCTVKSIKLLQKNRLPRESEKEKKYTRNTK